jgi:hypothetical protein
MSLRRVGHAAGALEALATLARRRAHTSHAQMRALLRRAPGDREPRSQEVALALRTDHLLKVLHVSCLWRAVVITEMLRRRGAGAHMRVSIERGRPAAAHAVVEAGSVMIGIESHDAVVLR